MIFSPHSTLPIIKGHIKENGNIGLAKKFIPFFSKEALVNSTYIQTLTKVVYTHKQRMTLKSFSGGTVVKNPCAMQEAQETQFPSLGQEDPLE